MKKYLLFSITLILSLVLMACDQKSNELATDKKEITVALPPSMHNIMMERLVKPELEKLGYKVKLVNFSSLRDSNTAIVEGGVDLNAAQHQSYLDNYNEKTGNDLVSLVHIPSISMAVFSKKNHSLDEIKSGSSIAIPNDASNTARALLMLKKLNLIDIKANANLGTLSVQDVINDKYNFKFQIVLSELMPRMLDEVDYAIMPGGVAFMSKIPSNYALYLEELTAESELMVVIKKENLDTQWAKDVKKLYQSQALKDFLNTDKEAKGRFIWPKY